VRDATGEGCVCLVTELRRASPYACSRDAGEMAPPKEKPVMNGLEHTNALTLEDLKTVPGGARNADNPFVKAALTAFDDAVRAGEAAQKEFFRANGPMGSSTPWKP
jgi:hypothetical protein